MQVRALRHEPELLLADPSIHALDDGDMFEPARYAKELGLEEHGCVAMSRDTSPDSSR
jgi:hypothetical protein